MITDEWGETIPCHFVDSPRQFEPVKTMETILKWVAVTPHARLEVCFNDAIGWTMTTYIDEED